jgi:hypothetical protein
MNPAYLGDSYDIVKRFFIEQLRAVGYTVFIDPMFTGDWQEHEAGFLKLLGVQIAKHSGGTRDHVALFLDPDTGVKKTNSKQHVSFATIKQHTDEYEIVASFDQSFSRQVKAAEVIQTKLDELHKLGVHGMYYDSHARFLFASQSANAIEKLSEALIAAGIPKWRLIAK